MQYINEDKTIITLPVPLGSILYQPVISCGDFCLFQKERFDVMFPPDEKESRCIRAVPCHTHTCTISQFTFTLNNLDDVLNDFGKWCFLSEQEAMQKGEEIIRENRTKMKEFGFRMNEDGYGKLNT